MCMFITPWYQPLVVQPILEPATKLPCMKLQCLMVKLIIPIVTTKSTLTSINYGKTGHLVETYHYIKK
jgi:hypothetical protein